MVVVFIVGTSQYTLAHGSTRGVDLHVGPTDEDHDHTRVVQDAAYLRMDAEPIPRKALPTVFNFGVEVEKANIGQAQTYALVYPKSIPSTVGTLQVSESVNGVPTINTLAGACVQRIKTRREGVRVLIRYEFKGRAWS